MSKVPNRRRAPPNIAINKQIKTEELKQLKANLKDTFGAGELQKMDDFLDIWSALER